MSDPAAPPSKSLDSEMLDRGARVICDLCAVDGPFRWAMGGEDGWICRECATSIERTEREIENRPWVFERHHDEVLARFERTRSTVIGENGQRHWVGRGTVSRD